jgi:hypothetical protein
MTIYCNVCAQIIEGPYSKEKIPSGVTSHASFVKCQSCTSKYPGITFADTAGRRPTQSSFEHSFYECSECGFLFWCETKGVPYAYSSIAVTACPKCSTPLPTLAQLDVESSEEFPPTAIMSGTDTLEKIRLVYETLTKSIAEHPSLSEVVTTVMLVDTSKGHSIWVIFEADSSAGRPIMIQLQKLSGLYFGSSKQLKYALKDEVTIIEQNKFEKVSN